MDTSVFYDLLKTPNKADLLSDELQAMVNDYPWFVHGQMLYSKSLQLLNDSNFDEQLHKTSVYTPNREVLYNLIVTPDPNDAAEENPAQMFAIHPEGIKHEVVQGEKSVPTNDKEALIEEKIVFRLLEDEQPKKKELDGGQDSSTTKLEIKEQSSVSDLAASANTAIPQQPSTTETLEDDTFSSESELIEAEQTAISKTPATPRVMDDLEKEIIIGAVSRVIEKEVEEELPEKVYVQEKNTDQEPKELLEENTAFSSFTSLILKRAKEVNYIDSNSGIGVNQPEADHTDKESDVDLKTKKKRLLDQFITNNPKISRGKLEDYESVNLGEASLQESDFFVTETMAKIYAQQGKKGKAKKTYKLLSLKYPEKSVYFAAQIKNLDKK